MTNTTTSTYNPAEDFHTATNGLAKTLAGSAEPVRVDPAEWAERFFLDISTAQMVEVIDYLITLEYPFTKGIDGTYVYNEVTA